MIPKTNKVKTFEIKIQPSKTYKVDFKKNDIRGFTDEVEAIKQAIVFILNTERYEYLIYSWNYGIELNDLFGEPVSYVYPELKRRIKEALLQDDRIKSVDNFSFSNKDNEVTAHFTVNTIFGDIEVTKVVNI